jgi:hypothetical protein
MKTQKIYSLILFTLLMSWAWPVRGQFGHLKGALIPGAAAALAFALSHADWRKAFPRAVVLGGIGFSLSGHFGYGKLIESIQSAPVFFSESYQYAHIFLIGFLTGGLGATLLGYGYSEKALNRKDAIFLAALGIFLWIPLGLLNLEDWDLFLYLAAFVILHAYNFRNKESRVIATLGSYGAVGFGFGFVIAVLILDLGSRGFFGTGWPWWALRDQIYGAIGGLFVWKSATRVIPAPGQDSHLHEDDVINKLGFLFLTVYIPVLNTIDVLKLWSKKPPLFGGAYEGLLILSSILFIFFTVFLFRLRPIPSRGSESFLASAFFFILYLSALAIAKEMMIFGWGRWETAYSLILIEALTLVIFLLVKFFRGKVSKNHE